MILKIMKTKLTNIITVYNLLFRTRASFTIILINIMKTNQVPIKFEGQCIKD